LLAAVAAVVRGDVNLPRAAAVAMVALVVVLREVTVLVRLLLVA
jgi:hypothetical protein